MKVYCQKCLYEWVTRKENPKACPRCKSYNWNRHKKKEVDKNVGETVEPSK